MKVEGCTQGIHFVSFFSFLTFVRQSSDNRSSSGHDGDGDGDGVTGDGSRLTYDGDGDGSLRGREFGKHRKEISNSSTPPLKKICVFKTRAATPKRYITQTLLPFYYLCRNHKPITMRNADLSNSIYQRKGSREGSLTIKNGMLINNRADGQTGIAQAAELKNAMKNAKKVTTIAEGIVLGVRLGSF